MTLEIRPVSIDERRLLADLQWTVKQLKALVTEDTGNGAFIRGTGTELVGFGVRLDQVEDTIRHIEQTISVWDTYGKVRTTTT